MTNILITEGCPECKTLPVTKRVLDLPGDWLRAACPDCGREGPPCLDGPEARLLWTLEIAHKRLDPGMVELCQMMDVAGCRNYVVTYDGILECYRLNKIEMTKAKLRRLMKLAQSRELVEYSIAWSEDEPKVMGSGHMLTEWGRSVCNGAGRLEHWRRLFHEAEVDFDELKAELRH